MGRDCVNMRFTTHLMLPFILASILLVGCSGTGSSGFNLYSPYYGSEGVEMQFLESAPPDTMYQGSRLKVGLLLQNRGAMDVTDATISLSYLDKYFDINKPTQSGIAIKGKSFIRRNGEKTPVFFDGEVNDLKETDVGYDDLSTPILATLCYSYTTHLEEKVCIDPDVYGLKERKKACIAQDLRLTDQGAPIAIKSVKQSVLDEGSSQTVYMELHIKNVGGGLVADASPSVLCSSASIGDEKISRLKINAQLGNSKMDCGRTDVVHLDSGEAVVTCSAKITADEEYATALKVDLTYGYSTTLPQNMVRIIRTP